VRPRSLYPAIDVGADANPTTEHAETQRGAAQRDGRGSGNEPNDASELDGCSAERETYWAVRSML
jgi:hypothetical protein